jgi:murein DD-endopeptidase MepM/ murein hydrolase activator NlpD
MKAIFTILLLTFSFFVKSQGNDRDSLIREFNKLSDQIKIVEDALTHLSKESDSIYNLMVNKELKFNKKFNYSEYLKEYDSFKKKYKSYVNSADFPSIIPIDISDSRVIIGYGEKMHPILKNMRFHDGVDIPASKGEPVKSTTNGKVEIIKNDFGGFGNHIVIKNSQGIDLLYSHLDSIYVIEGQRIQLGEVIGTVGNSGSTTATGLHYEIRIKEETLNPLFTFSSGLSKEELKYIWGVKEQTID